MLLVLLLAAAPGPAELLATAKQQLAAHHEVEARRTLERAKVLAAEQPALLARIHVYLGLAFAEAADEKKATDAFRAALKLDRAVELPPDSSPKVIEWWTKAGGTVQTAKVEPPPPAPPPPEPAPASPPPIVVEAPPPAPATVSVAESPPSPNRAWIGAAGVAVASGIVGAVLLGLADGRYRLITTSPHLGVTESMGIANEGSAFQTAGWSLLVVTVAAAVLAVVLGLVLK
jgi:hypothetical protein